jgi:hypothetical protein
MMRHVMVVSVMRMVRVVRMMGVVAAVVTATMMTAAVTASGESLCRHEAHRRGAHQCQQEFAIHKNYPSKLKPGEFDQHKRN